MKIERNKIIEATEAELMERYLKEWYDDIYSFREYLRLMVEAGVKIVEMKQVPEWEACVNAIEQAQKEAHNQAKREMFLNMQYYMEYCLSNKYVTPQEWIEKHKHF